MKYLKIAFIFYLISIALFSQERYQDINEKLNGDFEKIKHSNIKSKTVVLVSYTGDGDSIVGGKETQSVYKYNKDGKVQEWSTTGNMVFKKMRFAILYDQQGRISAEYLYIDSALFSTQDFIYNDFNKIEESKIVHSPGLEKNKITVYKFVYDANRNLTKLFSFADDSTYYPVEEYEYDENGRLKMSIQRLKVPGDTAFMGSKHEYSYNQEGKLAREKQFFLWSDNPTTKDYFYNPDGSVVKVHINWGASKTESEETYMYDTKGNNIEKIYTSEYGTEKTKYIYDENDNLIEEQYYSGQGEELKSSINYIFEFY